VTGVQTCALPILLVRHLHFIQHWIFAIALLIGIIALIHWQWSDHLPTWWPGSTDRAER